MHLVRFAYSQNPFGHLNSWFSTAVGLHFYSYSRRITIGPLFPGHVLAGISKLFNLEIPSRKKIMYLWFVDVFRIHKNICNHMGAIQRQG